MEEIESFGLIIEKVKAFLTSMPIFDDWASVLGIAVTLFAFFKFLKHRYQNHRAKLFWSGNLTTWNIIKPKYQNSMARIEDILASHEVKNMLDKCELSHIDVFDDRDYDFSKNTFLLCDQLRNNHSKELSKKFNFVYEIMLDSKTGFPYILDKSTGNKIYSPMDISNQRTDIAIAGCITVSSTKNKYCFVWGIHGVGTYGGAKFITSFDFIKNNYSKIKDKDFIMLIKVNFEKIDELEKSSLLSDIITGSEVFGR